MAFKVDRFRVELSRQAHAKLSIRDTLAFVEDWDFLKEFTECGLTDVDRENIEAVITVCPDGGGVVPVSENVRDIVYCVEPGPSVVIRYVWLKPSTVLLLAAYEGTRSHTLTAEEAQAAETYITHQLDYFSNRHTR